MENHDDGRLKLQGKSIKERNQYAMIEKRRDEI